MNNPKEIFVDAVAAEASRIGMTAFLGCMKNDPEREYEDVVALMRGANNMVLSAMRRAETGDHTINPFNVGDLETRSQVRLLETYVNGH